MSKSRETGSGAEVLFSYKPDFKGQDVLLAEAPLESGVTSRFLIKSLRGDDECETGCPAGHPSGAPNGPTAA